MELFSNLILLFLDKCFFSMFNMYFYLFCWNNQVTCVVVSAVRIKLNSNCAKKPPMNSRNSYIIIRRVYVVSLSQQPIYFNVSTLLNINNLASSAIYRIKLPLTKSTLPSNTKYILMRNTAVWCWGCISNIISITLNIKLTD